MNQKEKGRNKKKQKNKKNKSILYYIIGKGIFKGVLICVRSFTS